ncbi:MAG: glycosyltransferase family 39 protein [Chloroflexota bacterium]|nr:MAG: glycosyltransferase family 39 protein [Chloroflexota bacterium]
MSRSRTGQVLLPFIGYLILAVVLTWPLTSRLSTHLPDGTDSLLHYWNGWMTGQALRTGDSPYFTQLLFFPNGLSMVFNNFAWLHIVGWLALRPVVGGVAAYNMVFLLNLAMCGMAAYCLACELIGDRRIALLAGLVYQAWPHRLTQPSHPNLMSTWAIPIFLLFLTRAVKHRRWQDGMWAGLALALVGYVRWQLLIGAVLVGGLYLLLGLRQDLSRRSASVLALAAATAFTALLPPMILLTTEMNRNPTDLVSASDESAIQTDLLAYVTPASSHFLIGDQTESLYERYYEDRDSRRTISPYIGLATIFLLILAIWTGPRRQTLPWLAIGVLLLLLALGPSLRVAGRSLDLPMPYDLVRPLVFPILLREPDRFNIFLALPTAILAGYGTKQLVAANCSGRRYAQFAMPALAALILIDFLAIPMPLQSAEISPVYEEIAADPGEFAILNLPVDPFKSKPYMYAQTVHGRPIFQGHASRYPAGTFDYLRNQPWLESMMQFDQVPPRQSDISRQLISLADTGVRFIVLHKAHIEPGYLNKWRYYLAVEPWYEDREVIVYATESLADQDFSLEAELVPGLGIVGSQISTDCLDPDTPLAVDLIWGTSTSVVEEYGLQLTLSRGNEYAPDQQQFVIDDAKVSSWGANAIVHRYYEWADTSSLEDGEYSLIARLLLGNEPTGRDAFLGKLIVQSERCAFEVPPGATEVNASFGDSLRLLGYKLDREGVEVRLTLFWRGEQRMPTDYKVFVHIFEPGGGGVPVAQSDAMPKNWRYPTTLWGLNELVVDDIAVSLEKVASGQYGVAVGVYDPISGERLNAVDGLGETVAEGRLELPSVVSLEK